ncbi:sensor histidine kinase [Novosphingobium sp. Chol11]|uniref:sensor histidine kinase n=1 Tax=Novosphingobium sp. Chol11 TaxID=1385763 RepID=UPI000BE2AD96|nr:ATP-binding protein [Novosphingobium sp. Chol11]
MKRLRLWPQSLVGQIIVLVAIALFVAQAINFGLLLRERNRMTLTAQTAPGVYRIVDALDSRGEPPARLRPGRARFFRAPPIPMGEARPEIERRALAMFAEVGFPMRSVQVFEEDRPPPMRRTDSIRMRVMGDMRGEPRGGRLTMAAEYAPGKWVVTQTRAGNRAPRFGGWLAWQTLILYVIVLAPLLWVGRRLARPLGQLTRSAQQFARTGSADPVEERGPGDVRELTMAFNAMRSRIFAMLDEKDRMLGAIGHDLRTPLASLRVRAESVEDEGERVRMSQTIDEMNRMLEDILSLARAGRSSEAAQKVDIAALADAVVEDFVELGAPAEMAESERAVASVRPQQIRRALRNLIENAIVYGERAHVSVVREEGTIRLVVADDGPGIAEDRMDEMMEPFTRLEGSRNRETGGAGLGLALVRAIMAEHGGALKLANRAGGGLEASLVLPV